MERRSILAIVLYVATLQKLLPAAAEVSGWRRSFTPGHEDAAGHYLGGSETVHLESHGGELFAAIGYWEDTRNCIYAGTCWNVTAAQLGWAQVLRLDKPDGEWVVDLELGLGYVRTETLKSITFTTDAAGTPLEKPVTKLVAGAYSAFLGIKKASVWVRDDSSGSWERADLFPGDKDIGSVRSLHMHRDAVTGIDRAFLTVGTLGVVSGVWSSGKIAWDSTSESGPVAVRPLSMNEANGHLLITSGQYIYQRTDGVRPSWNVVHDMGGGGTPKAIGGIRGLTSIPNPSGEGQSLLFIWTNSSTNRGCMYRLDPDGSGGLVEHRETCLADIASAYLGTEVFYTLGAYNQALAVSEPGTGAPVHLVGFLARIECRTPKAQHCAEWDAPGAGGSGAAYYAGALFFIRRGPGEYQLNEVGGARGDIAPELVATRTYVSSPFASEKGGVVYFAGYDCNEALAPTNTAWVYSADIATVLDPLFTPTLWPSIAGPARHCGEGSYDVVSDQQACQDKAAAAGHTMYAYSPSKHCRSCLEGAELASTNGEYSVYRQLKTTAAVTTVV